METICSKTYRFSDTWDHLGCSRVSIYLKYINEHGQKCNKALRHFCEGYPVPQIEIDGIGDTYYIVDKEIDTVYFIKNDFFEFEDEGLEYFTFYENCPIIDIDGNIIEEMI